MRVLNVVMNLRVSSGVTSFIMNYYNLLDKEKYKIDFLELASLKTSNDQIVRGAGGNIYALTNSKRSVSYWKEIDLFFSKHCYDVIHIHTVGPSAALIMLAAKHHGIPIRIYHSHLTDNIESKRMKIWTKTWIYITSLLSNRYAACTEEAGKAAFKNKKFCILKNGVDINRFIYSEESRRAFRGNFNISHDCFVIATVCRPMKQKNPFFILDIAKECLKINSSTKLIWAGNGVLDNEVRQYAEFIGIKDKVLFLGGIKNVEDVYSAADVFYLPSLYEGLGIVYIESQISGLPTFASDVVPRDTLVSDLIKYLSLNDDAEMWAENICKMRGVRDTSAAFKVSKHGYDIKDCINSLERLYS